VDFKKQAALEAAGWKVGDAAEFLGLTEEERQIVEFRLMVGRGVRRQRMICGLSQQQLASRIGSSQARVAKIEAASSEVSLDLMLRGYFSAGGRIVDLIADSPGQNVSGKARPKPTKAGRSTSRH
jgi:Helix-turn-helix